MSDAVDWRAVFFDPDMAIADKLSTLARRRFGDSADAESAYNFALETLSTDNWQRLRAGYSSRGTPAGFLKTAFVRLLEDYATYKYGKKRPPVWLQRLGPVWKRIYEFLCLKRMPVETIVDHICAQGDEQPDVVRAACAQIKGRVAGCGQYVGEYIDDEKVAPEQIERTEPAAELERAQFGTLVAVISELMTRPGESADMADRLDALRASLKLEPHEHILLKMIYQQNASIAQAARALNVTEHMLRRRHEELIKRIRGQLERHGLDAQALIRASTR